MAERRIVTDYPAAAKPPFANPAPHCRAGRRSDRDAGTVADHDWRRHKRRSRASLLAARRREALRQKAAAALVAGYSVIIDAVSLKPEERRSFAAVAEAAAVPFSGLWLAAPASTMDARLRARHDDASDASPEVLAQQLQQYADPVDWLIIDAGTGPEGCLASARPADLGHSLIVLERETTTPGRPIRYGTDSYAATEYIPKTDPVAEGKGFEPLIARKMRRGSPGDLLLRERDRGFESLFLHRRVCEL